MQQGERIRKVGLDLSLFFHHVAESQGFEEEDIAWL